MRIRVLREQIDLFEMSVLEQAGELSPDDFQEPSGEQRPVPLVLVGRCLKADRAGEIRDLAQGVYRSGGAMLVVPPFPDPDLGKFFDTPVSLRLVRRSPDSRCIVVDPGAYRSG